MELLISEIHKRNVLWNKFHKKYRDRLASEKEWEAVARTVHMNSKSVK